VPCRFRIVISSSHLQNEKMKVGDVWAIDHDGKISSTSHKAFDNSSSICSLDERTLCCGSYCPRKKLNISLIGTNVITCVCTYYRATKTPDFPHYSIIISSSLHLDPIESESMYRITRASSWTCSPCSWPGRCPRWRACPARGRTAPWAWPSPSWRGRPWPARAPRRGTRAAAPSGVAGISV